jgi:hypothetical protein
MQSRLAILQSVNVELRLFKVELAPSHIHRFTDAQTVTIADQNQSMIPHRGAGFFGSCYQSGNFIRSEIFTRPTLKVCQFWHNFQDGE